MHSILVASALRPRCWSYVIKMRFPFRGLCGLFARFLPVQRYASPVPRLHCGQRLCAKKHLPSHHDRRRCSRRLLSRTRSLEGGFASPEARFASVRRHASPFYPCRVATPPWEDGNQDRFLSAGILRPMCSVSPFTEIRKEGSVNAFQTTTISEIAFSFAPGPS